uniref:Neur_chan_LBD domain-containing protein n=1 Tax=Heterorhabditis bacteriophora TaxID=37862 RepID=A0A1I7WCZ1_HETBA
MNYRFIYKRVLGRSCSMLQKLWIPNTCFINSKNAAIHESPFRSIEFLRKIQKTKLNNFRNVFLMVFANGTLWTNYRMKLTGPCDMNLKRFPFDQQKCFLTFESSSLKKQSSHGSNFSKHENISMKITNSTYTPKFRYNYNTGEVRMQWNQPYPVMLLKPIHVIAVEQVGKLKQILS